MDRGGTAGGSDVSMVTAPGRKNPATTPVKSQTLETNGFTSSPEHCHGNSSLDRDLSQETLTGSSQQTGTRQESLTLFTPEARGVAMTMPWRLRDRGEKRKRYHEEPESDHEGDERPADIPESHISGANHHGDGGDHLQEKDNRGPRGVLQPQPVRPGKDGKIPIQAMRRSGEEVKPAGRGGDHRSGIRNMPLKQPLNPPAGDSLLPLLLPPAASPPVSSVLQPAGRKSRGKREQTCRDCDGDAKKGFMDGERMRYCAACATLHGGNRGDSRRSSTEHISPPPQPTPSPVPTTTTAAAAPAATATQREPAVGATSAAPVSRSTRKTSVEFLLNSSPATDSS